MEWNSWWAGFVTAVAILVLLDLVKAVMRYLRERRK